ncbi:hypothetical protein SBP02_01580 [Pseudomonas benzenivorans]|uniref:Uncharacterized protein n=1 Tax=Pseudomonas benzenivorans TaxID=556533 RepID=A0ABZ0PWB4_9PSED|nr:hypothetical protein [Pseudomonas benzenivorans]WPC05472.1 hypothetical protein SBP02_01580 [Pseudomonas benzenivorans]
MPATPKTNWSKARNWVVGLTGVLLVVPALINAGADIYVAYNQLPRTESERVNVELFKKYFGKEPVARLPLPIKDGPATYEVRFSVYDGGDVFVEYGEMTQWFPFPKREVERHSSLSLIPSAQAADLTHLYGPYQQFDHIDGVTLVRNRSYASGAHEQQIIDMRTGQIIDYDVAPAPTLPPPSPPEGLPPVAPFAGIDLLQQQGPTPSADPATSCRSTAGPCLLLQPMASGLPCYCMTPLGPAYGQSY